MNENESTRLIESSIEKLERSGNFEPEVVFLRQFEEKYPDQLEKQDVKNIMLLILKIGDKTDIEDLFTLYITLKEKPFTEKMHADY